METITITEKQGCFQPPIARYSYMLIFYKEEEEWIIATTLGVITTKEFITKNQLIKHDFQ